MVDYPPRLRVLYISKCIYMTKLVIYATSLVSLTFRGEEDIVSLRSVPNLRELTIGGAISASFVLEPKHHSSYSSQLEKLVLDFRSRIRVKIHILILVHIFQLKLFICKDCHFSGYVTFFPSQGYRRPIVASPDLPPLCSLKQLKVQLHTGAKRYLLFFTSLIKASPQLSKFTIEVN